MHNIKKWWQNTPYWLKGAIYGLLLYIFLWILFFLVFSIITDIGFSADLWNKLSERGSLLSVFSGFIFLLIFFGVIGTLIGSIYNEINAKKKKYSSANLGGIIAVTIGIMILTINTTVIKTIRGTRFEILPIENTIIRSVTSLVLAYLLGALAGYGYSKMKKK